jgi:hypothetical protein
MAHEDFYWQQDLIRDDEYATKGAIWLNVRLKVMGIIAVVLERLVMRFGYVSFCSSGAAFPEIDWYRIET